MATWDSDLPLVSKDEVTVSDLNEGKRAANELRNDYWSRQSFRRLLLGTARDTNAAIKVTLLSADEIVMQDGSRSVNWANVSAQITLAGAGGLGAGAENPTSWYDIYAIEKSIDGTRNLMLYPSKTYVKDEESTSTGGVSNLQNNTHKLAQGFQTDAFGPVTFVEVMLHKVGLPTGSCYVTLETNNAGAPSGTVLATSDRINLVNVPIGATWLRFYFRVPVSLSIATQYHLVLQLPSATVDGANYLAWTRSTSDVYVTRGSVCTYNGATWTTTATQDFTFRVYIWSEVTFTLPVGYDRYCRIGFVYNNASNDFTPFSQFDNYVHNGSVGLGTMTNTTPALVDLSSVVPPLPCLVDVYIAHSAVGGFVGASPSHHPATTFNAGFQGGYAYIADVTTPYVVVPGIVCEGQTLYSFVGSGTGQIFSKGFRF
jgi:hypothetical protein